MPGSKPGGTREYGVTLIELLLALVLFAIGATALAGGMRTATRSVAMGRAWMGGAFAAESRFEKLRARCSRSAGAAGSGAVAEHWVIGSVVGPLLPSVEVEDSITLTMTAGVARGSVRSIVRCAP